MVGFTGKFCRLDESGQIFPFSLPVMFAPICLKGATTLPTGFLKTASFLVSTDEKGWPERTPKRSLNAVPDLPAFKGAEGGF